MQFLAVFSRKQDLAPPQMAFPPGTQPEAVPARPANLETLRILFLDQSGKLGGAELCLADIAQNFKVDSLVGVFAEGTFPDYLRQLGIPVTVLANQALTIQKTSGLWKGLRSLNQLIPLITTATRLARQYNLIYLNTQKALVVGAIASFFSHRPFVYHLHDIVSAEHFSVTNRRIIVTLANRAALIIANSHASKEAFIQAGGRANKIHVVYNGFRPETYAQYANGLAGDRLAPIKEDLGDNILQTVTAPFVVGHFSRLSPWKGQHVLIEALQYCPDNVIAILVGDALFGEQAYVESLHQQIKDLKLEHRVVFLGFRSDIPQLMSACDLVAHTSTAPEPFGRVIVEAMLCKTPVVAAAAGGVIELIEHEQTGWLTKPGDTKALAEIIKVCQNAAERSAAMAQQAQRQATKRFNVETVNAQIVQLLAGICRASDMKQGE